jgi:hypothetical protein
MIRSVCHHLCVEVLESVAHPHHPAALGRNAIFVASLDVSDSTVATTVTVADSIQRDMKNPNPDDHGQQELKDAPSESIHRRRSAAHPDHSEVVIVVIDALSQEQPIIVIFSDQQ